MKLDKRKPSSLFYRNIYDEERKEFYTNITARENKDTLLKTLKFLKLFLRSSGVSWDLYHKTFYGCNYLHTNVSYSVCPCSFFHPSLFFTSLLE
jgi:hypothetical protein